MAPLIRAVEVAKVFNAGRPSEFRALRGVSLEVEAGAATVLEGPSGSGKTTLLAILGCMARPTAGRVFLQDREITSLPERFLTAIRRRTVGFVFQHANLIPGRTCLENVMFPAYTGGERHRVLRARAEGLLETLDLSHRAAARVEWLSGGETQRVAIARALINDPAVLIADEPTAHLDSALSAEFLELMGRFRAQGRTLLMASHDPLVCRAGLVDRVVEMRDGALRGAEAPG